MKKSLKITALAGALALCLLLSGCYQPPDEVNNGNPSGNTPALFDTMAPTATVEVTPDTVVIETQNIYGGNDGQQTLTPTPTPPEGGGNGWDNWGIEQTATPTLTPGVSPRQNVPLCVSWTAAARRRCAPTRRYMAT